MEEETKPRKIFKVDIYNEDDEYIASTRVFEDEPVSKIWSVFGKSITEHMTRFELKTYK